MALIKCPECNRDVSDKADKCIHCGYPLTMKLYHENINGIIYDLSFLDDKNETQAHKMIRIKNLTGCDIFKAKEIVLKYCPTELKSEHISHPPQPKCPRCGSTAITAGQRGYSLLWGFLGSGNAVNRCSNCGNKWKP